MACKNYPGTVVVSHIGRHQCNLGVNVNVGMAGNPGRKEERHTMKKKRGLLFSSIILLFLLCGCGSGGGDTPNDDTHKVNGSVDMTGLWFGETATQNNGEVDTSFQLSQDGCNISGSLTFGNATTHNVTGFIHDSNISLSGIFQTRQGVELEFAYEGIVSGGDFSGTFTMFDLDDSSTQEKGTFSLAKNENAPDTAITFEYEKID
jgi:hypothetical protein